MVVPDPLTIRARVIETSAVAENRIRQHEPVGKPATYAAKVASMFLPFFLELKAAKVPVSLREYLTLMEGLDAGLARSMMWRAFTISRVPRW
jgi:hypothetical protein